MALLFAAALLPLSYFAALAIDYSRGSSVREELKYALDAAVLAGANAPAADRVVRAEAVFHAAVGPQIKPVFAVDAAGVVTGTLSTTLDNSILRGNGIGIDLTAQAGLKNVPGAVAPTQLTFKILAVKGWFWKRMTLKVIDANDVERTLGQWEYNYNINPTSSLLPKFQNELPLWDLTNGEGVVTNGGAPIANGDSQTIDLPVDFKRAWLTMEVRTDKCGLGKTLWVERTYVSVWRYGRWTWEERRTNKCVDGGQTQPDYVFNTLDPNAYKNMLIISNGMKKRATSASDIALTVGCGEEKTLSWEDTNTEDPSMTSAPWTQQDFFFKVTGKQCQMNKNMIDPTGAASAKSATLKH